MKRNKRLSNSGLSLVEVSIFTLFAIGAAYLSFQASTQSLIARKKVKQFLGYVQFTNYVRSVVGNQYACGAGLGIISVNNQPTATVQLQPGSKAQVTVYSPVGEQYQTGTMFGAVTLTDLSITLNATGTPVPGSKDQVYSGTLNVGGQKTMTSTTSVQPFTLPLAVRLNSSGNMVACSSYRGPNQAILSSPPCDQYSISSMSTDGNSVICKKVLCDAASVPVGYNSDGSVICGSLSAASTCTAPGQALILVNGQYKCKTLSCPAGTPLAWQTDSDGFVTPSGCSTLSKLILNCTPDPTVRCKTLFDPYQDPGATQGYFCDTSQVPGSFCKDNCSLKSTDTGKTCPLVNNNHTAAQCLTAGGSLVLDPNPSTTQAGRVVCAFSAPTGSQASCPSGWYLYGKNYSPTPALCPTLVTTFLDWNGRDGCWPNCAGQGDSFPQQFGDPVNNPCENWLIQNHAYQYTDTSRTKTSLPQQTNIPSGFYPASTSNVNINSFACYVGAGCKLCGNPNQNFLTDILDISTLGLSGIIIDGATGIIAALEGASSQYTTATQANGNTRYTFQGAQCPSPNVTYVNLPPFINNRCDMNCYSSPGVFSFSSCHMALAYDTQKVNFNVTTYCK